MNRKRSIKGTRIIWTSPVDSSRVFVGRIREHHEEEYQVRVEWAISIPGVWPNPRSNVSIADCSVIEPVPLATVLDKLT